MKKIVFGIICILLLGSGFQVTAQGNQRKMTADSLSVMASDTFQKIRMKIYLGETRMKTTGMIHRALAKANDPQVNSYIKASKTTGTLSIIAGGLGGLLAGAGLASNLSGEPGNSELYIWGGLATLGSGVLSLVSYHKRKKGMARYNALVRGQTPFSSFDPDQSPGAMLSSGSTNHLTLNMGWGWSKQHTNYDFDQNYLNAKVFSISLLYDFPLDGNWDFQTGIGLTQHGFGLENNSTSNGIKLLVKADARLRYLELPLMLNYRLSIPDSRWEIKVSPGIYAGYAVSGKAVARGVGENKTRKVRTYVADKIALKTASFSDRMDAGATLGASVTYHLGPGSVFAGGRYYLGLLNLERAGPDSEDKAYNRSIYLKLGYTYLLEH